MLMFPGISREKIKNRKQNKLIKNLTPSYKSRYFYIFRNMIIKNKYTKATIYGKMLYIKNSRLLLILVGIY